MGNKWGRKEMKNRRAIILLVLNILSVIVFVVGMCFFIGVIYSLRRIGG